MLRTEVSGDEAKHYRAVRRDDFKTIDGELVSANEVTGEVVIKQKVGEKVEDVTHSLGAGGIAIVARSLILCAALALGLSACANPNSGGPAQPTATQIAAGSLAVTATGLDPLSLRDAGFLLVNQTCDQFLVDQSLRSNLFGTAQSVTTLGGTAAATFMASGGNPMGAATAGIATGLASSLLGILQNSPTMPYSAATSEKVREAVAAIEDGAAVPANQYQSMIMIEDAWWPCSLPGAAEIAQTAISTASISSSSPTTAPGFAAFAAPQPTGFHRRRVLVNGR